MARDIDMGARRPDGVRAAPCEAILQELTGASPDWQWRASIGPEAASVAVLAKSVCVLASMLAGREGVTLPIAGLLDDMTASAASDPRVRAGERVCLGCNRPFASAGAANRLCAGCAALEFDGEDEAAD